MFNFSIIIPHKNIPSLLRRCLNSIPNRSDLEVIVVDDNSNEETIKDLETIQRNNLQIVYTKDGKGAGFARNIGIKKAHGKWILFADADDFFLSSFAKELNTYKDCPLKLILFKSICRHSEDLNKIGNRQELCDSFSKKMDAFQCNQTNATLLLIDFCVPWAKMIRLDFLLENNLLFEEVKYANDVKWGTNLALKIKDDDVIISKEPIYCLTDRTNSLFHTRDAAALFCRFGVCYRQQALLAENNIHIPFDFRNYIIQAQPRGILFFVNFCNRIMHSDFQIPAVYPIEQRFRFKKPYLYIFSQLAKTIACIPFRFINFLR